jgi:hypothetical protein
MDAYTSKKIQVSWSSGHSAKGKTKTILFFVTQPTK